MYQRTDVCNDTIISNHFCLWRVLNDNIFLKKIYINPLLSVVGRIYWKTLRCKKKYEFSGFCYNITSQDMLQRKTYLVKKIIIKFHSKVTKVHKVRVCEDQGIGLSYIFIPWHSSISSSVQENAMNCRFIDVWSSLLSFSPLI